MANSTQISEKLADVVGILATRKVSDDAINAMAQSFSIIGQLAGIVGSESNFQAKVKSEVKSEVKTARENVNYNIDNLLVALDKVS